MTHHLLGIVNKYRTQKPHNVLDAATDFLAAHGVNPSKMSRIVENDCVELECRDADFQYIQLAQHKLDVTWFRIAQAPIADYEGWLARYFFNSDFVMAWVVDAEDNKWQNEDSPEAYHVAGRSHTHLKKISNGLPAPLNQTVLDISNNPGRWIYRQGYVDAIGSPMWLSKTFWELTGGNRAALLDRKWSTPVQSDIERIQLLDRCFDSTRREDAALQKALRSFLFRS